ncbi:hypothetical protein M2437_002211 [Methylorubrum pseudosasae]|nr:hypothetical protein [Methylorubrum pseudosasae]
MLDVPQHVLSFWEARIAEVRSLRTMRGQRRYRPKDVELMIVIRVLLHVPCTATPSAACSACFGIAASFTFGQRPVTQRRHRPQRLLVSLARNRNPGVKHLIL